MSGLSLFDYAGISPESVNEVRAAAERIRVRMKRTVEDIIAIGLDLIAVKEKLPHGAFLPWIGAEFDMSDQTARRFMQVADRYGKSNIMLNLPPTVLFELAAPSTPDPIRQQIEAKAEAGESVSIEEVKRLKREAMEAAKAKVDAEARASTAEADAARYKLQAETVLDGQRELLAKTAREVGEKLSAEIDAMKANADKARKELDAAKAEQTRIAVAAKEAAELEARGRAEKLASEEVAKRKADLEKLERDCAKVVADIDRRHAALRDIEGSIAMKQALDQRLSSVDYENKEILKEATEIMRLQEMFMVTLSDIEYQNDHHERVRKVVAHLSDQCGKLQRVLQNLYLTHVNVVEIAAVSLNG